MGRVGAASGSGQLYGVPATAGEAASWGEKPGGGRVKRKRRAELRRQEVAAYLGRRGEAKGYQKLSIFTSTGESTHTLGQGHVSLDASTAVLERQVKEGIGRDKLQRLSSCARLYKPPLKGVCSGHALSLPPYLLEPGLWGNSCGTNWAPKLTNSLKTVF